MHGLTVGLKMCAEFFEHGGEPSGFIKGGEFRDQHGLRFPK
jgi:hypothetical protein